MQPAPQQKKVIKQIKTIPQKTNFANQILIGVDSTGIPITIYFPAYLTVKVNNIESISIGESIAKMNLTVIYSIYFGTDITEDLVNEICLHLQLGFSRDQPIRMKKFKEERIRDLEEDQQSYSSDSSEQEEANIYEKNFDKKTGMKRFVINKTFQVNLTPYASFTPFEIHDLNICFELRKVELKFEEPKKNLQIKFNLMSTNVYSNQSKQKILNCRQMNSFGYYELLQNFLIFQNTIKRPDKNLQNLFKNFPWTSQIIDQSKNLKIEEKPTQDEVIQYCENKNFQYSSFHIPIYKKPMVSFATIFLPLWVLSLINLCLFFCQNDYSQRLAAIATLTLAFVPTVQMVRNQIPQTPRVTFVEVAIYAEIFATFLFLMESYTIRLNQDYEFCPFCDAFFLFSFLITISIIVFPLGSLLLYSVYLKKYKLSIIKSRAKKTDSIFERKQWAYNVQAENFFKAKKLYLQNFIDETKQNTIIKEKLRIKQEVIFREIKNICQSASSTICKPTVKPKAKAEKEFKANFCRLINQEGESDEFKEKISMIGKWKKKNKKGSTFKI